VIGATQGLSPISTARAVLGVATESIAAVTVAATNDRGLTESTA
jgi:hypothetical protein